MVVLHCLPYCQHIICNFAPSEKGQNTRLVLNQHFLLENLSVPEGSQLIIF